MTPQGSGTGEFGVAATAAGVNPATPFGTVHVPWTAGTYPSKWSARAVISSTSPNLHGPRVFTRFFPARPGSSSGYFRRAAP